LILLNANNYRIFSITNLFYLFVIILISSNLNSQNFIIINQQDLNFFKWQELNSKNIQSSKIGPFNNLKSSSNSLLSSFYRDDISGEKISEYNLFSKIIVEKNVNPRYKFHGFIDLQFSKNMTLYNKFEFDNQGEYDSDFQGVERGYKNGWVGYIQHSSITYNYQKGLVSLGRGNPYYFNFNESLLINRSFPPKEYIMWNHANSWFNYDWVTIMLDGIIQNGDVMNRLLTLHRYSISLDKLRLGFTEALISSYSKFGVAELGYLMPSTILLETEANRGSNANLVWLFDGLFKFDEWTFNYEVLIDDFAIDGLSPPKIGLSTAIGRKINNIVFFIDYTHLTRWTGNHCDSLQRWTENNQPIGHALGADGKSLSLASHYKINNKFALEVHFEGKFNNEELAPSMMEVWPVDIKCDYNFNNNQYSKIDKKHINNFGLVFYYLISKNFYTKISLDYTNDNFKGGIVVNYKYKTS
tara:strand:- start:2135 stop:3544 length:1410 start_codon:yes stop_codon:yes gene_type:complete